VQQLVRPAAVLPLALLLLHVVQQLLLWVHRQNVALVLLLLLQVVVAQVQVVLQCTPEQ
jgi:hypothetical protein